MTGNCDGRGSLARAFRAFAHPLRREVLCLLFERDQETVTLEELSERLADRLDDQSPKQLELNLHHMHLPKLQQQGVLAYDAQRGTVRCLDLAAVRSILNTSLVEC